MSFDLWLAFLTAALLLAAAPGPDNLFVLMQSAMHGARAGVFVTFGLCCGVFCHTLLAALGVAALIAGSPVMLTILKFAGALYLFWLAWGAWRAPVDDRNAKEKASPRLTDAQLWRRGIVMNLTNPKVLLFFLAFFPSFILPGTTADAATLQMLLMGAAFLVVTLVVFSLFAWCAGALADRVRTPEVQRFFNKLSSLVFAALAISTLSVSV